MCGTIHNDDVDVVDDAVDVVDVIQQVVAEKVNARETFTAWDISVLVWKQGISASHDSLKAIVHDGYSYKNWASEYMKRYFDLGKGYAAVFYHKDVDPQEYIDTVMAKIADELANQDDDDDSDDTTGMVKVKNVDEQNRLRFTKDILNTAGYEAGDQVSVVFDGDDIILRDANTLDGNVHTIDSHCNLRVSLNAVGYTDPAYKIDVTNDTIVASPVYA
jgi:hypothetical protein